MPKTMTGGCACGRIRFSADIADDEAYLCHCRMCQRAMGNVSVAFKNVPKSSVSWKGASPDLFESSPIAKRGFCATCGTSLTFAYDDSEKMDLMVGAFDEPGYFRPKSHFGVESIHRPWLETTGLPEMRTDEHEPLKKRWLAATGKLPE